jgi:fibro-slime domain-containing protein
MLKKLLLPVLAVSAIACSSNSPDSVGGPVNGNGNGTGGGFVIGPPPGSTGGISGTPTGPGALNFIIRDFKFYDANDKNTNPDFENVPKDRDGDGNPVKTGSYLGPWDDHEIVTDQLVDHLPVYKNQDSTTLTTHGKKGFDQWFHSVDGVNITQSIPVTLTKNADGAYEYDSKTDGPLNKDGMFFPIDDGTPYATKFGNQTGRDSSGRSHNYSFTLEIHTLFTYQGGENFTFRGDDDVFVFIDNKLVINLGGIHGTETKAVDIDSLGLTKGNTYNLDFFYAERHVVASDLHITTGLELSNNSDIPIL